MLHCITQFFQKYIRQTKFHVLLSSYVINHMLWFIFLGIAPGQGKKLFKLIQEPSDLKTTSCDLERAVVNLYMESRDKDIKKQLLSLISLSHTKKELQQLIPQLSVYAINEARKHALDKKEGRFSLNTMNNVSNWN